MNAPTKQKCLVSSDFEGVRIEKFLMSHSSGLSFPVAAQLIRKKHVWVDGKVAKKSQRMLPGQVVLAYVDFKTKVSSGSVDDRLRSYILEETDEWVAINKPAGMAVQGGSRVRLHIDGLARSYGWSLVHRLDKETSGVLILAKNKVFARFFSDLLQKRAVRKIYYAVTSSRVEQNNGKISLPIQYTKSGSICASQGLKSCTSYTLLRHTHKGSFLKVLPHTGRKHQIRVHLSQALSPIVGDLKYGGAKAPYLFLHACELHFCDAKGNKVSVKAPIPLHMHDL